MTALPSVTLRVENCDRMWELYLRSFCWLSRAFLELLLAGKGKSILNIGTCNWMVGEAPFTIYNASTCRRWRKNSWRPPMRRP